MKYPNSACTKVQPRRFLLFGLITMHFYSFICQKYSQRDFAYSAFHCLHFALLQKEYDTPGSCYVIHKAHANRREKESSFNKSDSIDTKKIRYIFWTKDALRVKERHSLRFFGPKPPTALVESNFAALWPILSLAMVCCACVIWFALLLNCIYNNLIIINWDHFSCIRWREASRRGSYTNNNNINRCSGPLCKGSVASNERMKKTIANRSKPVRRMCRDGGCRSLPALILCFFYL